MILAKINNKNRIFFHVANLLIIISLIFFLGFSILRRIYFFNVGKHFVLKKKVEIIDPKTMQSMGYLDKGVLIKTPSFFDIDDFNENIKFKVLILPDDFESGFLEKHKISNEIQKYLIKDYNSQNGK
ncbi:hypothetical protein [Leptospira santarosai]|uniref:hypothetical protein n=1 Tax=Leptospira santarosai TaxID=28183 RepID=UPI00077398F2|nr:hypothetical protein [Leptospira santarosai]